MDLPRAVGIILLLLLLLGTGCRPDRSPDQAGASARQTATLAPTIPVAATPDAALASSSPTPTLVPLPPDERLAAAVEAERIGEWEQAMQLYESLRGDPTLASDALLRLGDLYLRDEREVAAVAAWQEALARAPGGPDAPALRYRLARGLTAVGQHQAAIELWQQVDAANDGVDWLLAQRLANAYEAIGNRAAAVAQLERLYALPDADRVARARAANRLGDWHAANERWQEARQWYERTLALSEIHTFRAQLLAAMARLATSAGDEEGATLTWQRLLEEFPDTPEALEAADVLAARGLPISLLERGRLLRANERWAEAGRTFFAALEEVDLATTHAQAAEMLEAQGAWAAAGAEWRKIRDTHPGARTLHDDALLGIARSQARGGQATAALATLALVTERFPEGDAAPAALWERAALLAAQDASPDDVAAAYEALAAYPEWEQTEEALWQAGWLRYNGGQLGVARADWEALGRLGGARQAQGNFWAGKAALQAGDAEGATRLWERAQQGGGAGYYELRAAALLTEAGWQPRARSDLALPPSDEAALAWLQRAAGTDAEAELTAAPTEPRFQQGETLLWLGERDLALDAFGAAIEAQRTSPLALWGMATRLRDLQEPRLSILAAQTLMDHLGVTLLDAPLPLAALAYPLPYAEPLREASALNNFDPLFFAALIHQESLWEPRARSAAAARGLTQVIPDTGSWIAQRLGDGGYAYRRLDRPVVSLRYGSYYLDFVLDQFDDNPFHALAAYNSGPGNARRWLTEDDDLYLERVSLAETRLYLQEIYKHWVAYERIYRSEATP